MAWFHDRLSAMVNSSALTIVDNEKCGEAMPPSSTDLKDPSPSPNPIDLKLNPDALPQKRGSTLSRYLQRE